MARRSTSRRSPSACTGTPRARRRSPARSTTPWAFPSADDRVDQSGPPMTKLPDPEQNMAEHRRPRRLSVGSNALLVELADGATVLGLYDAIRRATEDGRLPRPRDLVPA